MYALLGAGAASALGIFHPSRDLVFGNRLVHCRMDLRGPSNGRLIRYGPLPESRKPAGESGFCRAVEYGLVAAIARLAGLCPAGAALRWIKAVCLKLEVGGSPDS
jgi:hypothetical protein